MRIYYVIQRLQIWLDSVYIDISQKILFYHVLDFGVLFYIGLRSIPDNGGVGNKNTEDHFKWKSALMWCSL